MDVSPSSLPAPADFTVNQNSDETEKEINHDDVSEVRLYLFEVLLMKTKIHPRNGDDASQLMGSILSTSAKAIYLDQNSEMPSSGG